MPTTSGTPPTSDLVPSRRNEHIKRQSCINQCGWYRDFTDDNEYRTFQFRHPLYGLVTGMQAAIRDISHHNCDTYREAVQRQFRRNKHHDDSQGSHRAASAA